MYWFDSELTLISSVIFRTCTYKMPTLNFSFSYILNLKGNLMEEKDKLMEEKDKLMGEYRKKLLKRDKENEILQQQLIQILSKIGPSAFLKMKKKHFTIILHFLNSHVFKILLFDFIFHKINFKNKNYLIFNIFYFIKFYNFFYSN